MPLPQASAGSQAAPARQVVVPFAALIFAVQVELSQLPAFGAAPQFGQAAPADQAFAVALVRPAPASPEALLARQQWPASEVAQAGLAKSSAPAAPTFGALVLPAALLPDRCFASRVRPAHF